MADTNMEISNTNSKRINIVKVVFIYFVIVLHAYGNSVSTSSGDVIYPAGQFAMGLEYFFSRYICQCAVPGFFFISAVLLYRKPHKYTENVKKKVRSLLIPFLIVNLIWIVLCAVCAKIPYVELLCGQDIWQLKGIGNICEAVLGIRSGYPFTYPLWFIRDLFLINLLSKPIELLCKRVPRLSFILFLLCALIVGQRYFLFFNLVTVWYWGLGCTFVILLPRLQVWVKKIKCKYILSGALWVVIGGLLTANIFSNLLIASVLANLGCILGIISIWGMSRIFVANPCILCLLDNCAESIFFIYLFHEKTLSVVRRIVAKLLPCSSYVLLLSYCLLPFLIFVVLLFMAKFIKRRFRRFYLLIIGGR